MPILPNTTERQVAAFFPQPVSEDDQREARHLVYAVYYINCVSHDGPRLSRIVYRSSDEEQDILRPVYRYDIRNYTEIFQVGFQAPPQGDTLDPVYYNLLDAVNYPDGATPRGFIITTLSLSMTAQLTYPIGSVVYRYEINAPGGIWVGESLGDHYGFHGQKQVAFVGGIAPQYIRAAQPFKIASYNSQGDAVLERPDKVQPRIALTMRFDPQTDPAKNLTIENPAYYFINLAGQREQLFTVFWDGGPIDPSGPGGGGGDTRYTKGVFDAESYINAAFRSTTKNQAYMFMRNEYILVDYAPGTYNDQIISGPLLISEGFPYLADTAFGEQGIDCAFASQSSNEAYIFSSNLCALINYDPNSTNARIIKGPMTISDMFPFFENTAFENGIDAAFVGTVENEAYLFKGSQYALINYSYPTLIAMRPITTNFVGWTGTVFEQGIEAAFASHVTDEAYIFKGKDYALVKFAEDSLNDPISVKEIVPDYWPSLTAVLPRKNRGLDAHA